MRNLIGLPYKLFGKDEKGIDCYNLVKLYYKKNFNVEIQDDFSLINKKDIVNLKKIKDQQNTWFKCDIIENGVLLLFRVNNFPLHCGVAINNKQFLHIQENKTSCIEKISIWKNKILGIYKYLG